MLARGYLYLASPVLNESGQVPRICPIVRHAWKYPPCPTMSPSPTVMPHIRTSDTAAPRRHAFLLSHVLILNCCMPPGRTHPCHLIVRPIVPSSRFDFRSFFLTLLPPYLFIFHCNSKDCDAFTAVKTVFSDRNPRPPWSLLTLLLLYFLVFVVFLLRRSVSRTQTPRLCP